METGKRLFYIDLMKGFIMLLMALDHARAFISKNHPSEFWAVPMPDYQGDGFAFITRLVTHLSAPGFFFIMGVSMVLYERQQSAAGASVLRVYQYFVIRGLMLIGLQFTVVNLAWLFGALSATGTKETYGTAMIQGSGGDVWVYFGVLSALGSTMLVAFMLLRLPKILLFLLSLLSIATSMMILPDLVQLTEPYPEWLRILALPGYTGHLIVRYPLLPWLSLTLCGVIYGRCILNNFAATRKISLFLGVSFLVMFIVLRYRGGFGNIHPPNSQQWIDFLDVTKYPPSLCFLLLTMGVNLIIMTLFSYLKADFCLAKWCAVFGRATLFFYVIHLYLYAAMGYLFPKGISLLAMYPVWIVGLILLFPLCNKFIQIKADSAKNSILRYV